MSASTLSEDTIRHILENTDFTLEDYLSIISSQISGNWSNVARSIALPILAESQIQVDTSYFDDGRETTEYEHLYPVIRRIPVERRVLPDDRLVFEPDFDGALRYSYHRNQYRPREIIMRMPGRTLRWSLQPDIAPPRYEVVRNEHGSYIPATNITQLGPGDRFTIFNYHLEQDFRREFPVKVFYKTNGDMKKLHCMSIPLRLLGWVLKKEREGEY
jgi:hypothetical protein